MISQFFRFLKPYRALPDGAASRKRGVWTRAPSPTASCLSLNLVPSRPVWICLKLAWRLLRDGPPSCHADPPKCHYPGLEKGWALRREAVSSAGVRWNSVLFPSERQSIALLLRLNLKEVKLKPHKKYDYYKMLKPLPAGPEPCLSHPCLGCRSHRLTL